MILNLGAKIGIAIGLIGGLIGLSVGIWAAPGMGSVMAVIFIGVFAVVYLTFIRPMMQNSALLKTGLPGRAMVLDVIDTGVYINDNPQVKLQLEVTPDDGRSAYQAEARVIVPRFNPTLYAPGVLVEVRYDPNNTSRVAVVESSAKQASRQQAVMGSQQAVMGAQAVMGSMMQQRLNTMTPQEKIQRQKMLSDVITLNNYLSANGTRAAATVLSKDMTHIVIDAETMLITLNLMISPFSGAPFSAQATLPVTTVQEGRYNPGMELQVAYDPANTTRVAVQTN